MKMDTSPHLRRASSMPILLLLLLLLVANLSMSTCRASPVASPMIPAPPTEAAATPVALEKPQNEVDAVVFVEVEMDDGDATSETPTARDETVSEELTPGAIISGNLDGVDSDSESVEASSLVQRMVLDPTKFLRLIASDADGAEDEEDEGDGGSLRIGEIGTIISVIKIATEVGEAVLPVVIKEVEGSPIGNLVIGVIGGYNDGSAASTDNVGAMLPIPIKVAHRAARGFLKALPINI